MDIVSRLPTYFQIANMTAQSFFAYRANVALSLASVLIQVYLLRTIWTAVYAGSESVNGITLNELIAYLTLVNLQLWVMSPYLGDYLRRRIPTGQIATDLTRPVGLLSQLVAQNIGYTASMAPIVLIGFPFALVVGQLQGPQSMAALLNYGMSLCLAYLVNIQIAMLLGLIAFWIIQNWGFMYLYQYVNQFFAGALVPLWFLPPEVRQIAELLPFQAQGFIPISIYLGHLEGVQLVQALVLQLFWVLALYACARLVWRIVMRRISIQGG